MQKEVKEVINLLTKAFSANFDDFKGLYLIGLFADGKEHESEDIEIVAIFDTENKEKREIIWPIVGKIETDLDVFIDLTPTTIADLEKDEELWEEVEIYGRHFNSKGQEKKK